jgi:hypothetical protein
MKNNDNLIKFPVNISDGDAIPDVDIESNFSPEVPRESINKEGKIIDLNKNNKKCQKQSKTLI